MSDEERGEMALGGLTPSFPSGKLRSVATVEQVLNQKFHGRRKRADDIIAPDNGLVEIRTTGVLKGAIFRTDFDDCLGNTAEQSDANLLAVVRGQIDAIAAERTADEKTAMRSVQNQNHQLVILPDVRVDAILAAETLADRLTFGREALAVARGAGVKQDLVDRLLGNLTRIHHAALSRGGERAVREIKAENTAGAFAKLLPVEDDGAEGGVRLHASQEILHDRHDNVDLLLEKGALGLRGRDEVSEVHDFLPFKVEWGIAVYFALDAYFYK